jgi:hypothetical protein
MRRIVPSLFLCGALAALTGPGCGPASSTAPPPGGTSADVLVFESEEVVELVPGGPEKPVGVKSGKAESAEAPKESGVTAKVEGNKVILSAGKDAKEGDHTVTVKGGKKDATIKVHVKKKE